jgi:hypothetical protein
MQLFARKNRLLSMTPYAIFLQKQCPNTYGDFLPTAVFSRAIRKFVVCEDTNDGVKR